MSLCTSTGNILIPLNKHFCKQPHIPPAGLPTTTAFDTTVSAQLTFSSSASDSKQALCSVLSTHISDGMRKILNQAKGDHFDSSSIPQDNLTEPRKQSIVAQRKDKKSTLL